VETTRPRFGAGYQVVLASACARARRNQASRAGTAHVLVSLLNHMDGPAQTWWVLRRALRARPDRAGPDGAGPDGAGPDGAGPDGAGPEGAGPEDRSPSPIAAGGAGDPLDREVDAALREAAWRSSRLVRRRPVPPPGWHPAVRTVLRRTLSEAGAAGVSYPGLRYLLEAVLADPDGQARALLRSCGLDKRALVAEVDGSGDAMMVDEPPNAIAAGLAEFRLTEGSADRATFPERFMRMFTRRTRVDVMQIALELEVIRQAVRLGSGQVTTVHLVLATLELDRNLAEVGANLAASLIPANEGGRVLAEHGIDYSAAASGAAELTVGPEPVAAEVPGPWWWRTRRRRWWRTSRRNPPWAGSASQAADIAATDAASRRTRAGSSHLLVAALADPGGAAARLLRRLGADPEGIAEETARRLSASTG
jgi:hypothetical protein